VDLYVLAARPRTMDFTGAWPTPGNHTVEVLVLGAKIAASSGKRVDVDACVALR
jgi:hypothetical protein